MSFPQHTIGSRIVEVVINSRFSHAVALGKRKASEAFASSSKRAQDSSSSEDSEDGSEYYAGEDGDDEDIQHDLEDVDEDSEVEAHPPGSATPSERRYPCTHEGCRKAYTKPSRLAEHLRSHTGERPYVCKTCNKSYLRETHLQAHSRSHLPAAARPHVCTEEGCDKRFWTTQHLGVHVARVHHGEKAFACVEVGCAEAFAKHNQLRRHVAETHSPSGTKPFRCDAKGCTKSFSTSQKLRKHSKVHQDNRYACIDTKCTSNTMGGSSSSLYFPTWTALQAHLREFHPPTCPHAECGGRVFASQKGLKGHLKVHDEREIEDALEKSVAEGKRPTKRRRGGEVGRDWACEVAECVKTFKSKKALTNHHNITHLGRRDHVCGHAGCGATFGYKHLLQRHAAKVHPVSVAVATADSASEAEDVAAQLSIEWLTGKSYTSPSMHRNTRRALVPCPWPDRFEEVDVMGAPRDDDIVRCAYVFSRAYDLRRHLKAEHGLELDKEEVDAWAKGWRERHSEDI